MLNLPKGYVFKYNFIDLYLNIQFTKKKSKSKTIFSHVSYCYNHQLFKSHYKKAQ